MIHNVVHEEWQLLGAHGTGQSRFVFNINTSMLTEHDADGHLDDQAFIRRNQGWLHLLREGLLWREGLRRFLRFLRHLQFRILLERKCLLRRLRLCREGLGFAWHWVLRGS